MSKKTILILISVIITIGIIVGLIYFFTNKNKAVNVNVVDNQYTTFDPFGTSGEVGSQTNNNNQVAPNVEQTAKFYRITDFAIAGATFFQDKRMSTINDDQPVAIDLENKQIPPGITFDLVPSLRYVERSTGHVYNMDIETKTKEKISNTTIPGVHDALFNKEADSVIYRYISSDNKTISSFLAALGGAKGEYLPTNILEVVASPDKSKFFYLTKSNNGVVGTIRTINESTKTEAFSSPFTEWLPQWTSDSTIFITTKASVLAPGVMFSFDIKTKTMTKILGGVNGLTTLVSNDGMNVLYGASINGRSELNILNIKEHKTTPLSASGLPEKCVWSKNGVNIYCAIPNMIPASQYPDSWYQGFISFSDSFIKIDITNGGVSEILDSESVTAVDATNLFLSDNEEQLFFTNKKDSTLWGLNLN